MILLIIIFFYSNFFYIKITSFYLVRPFFINFIKFQIYIDKIWEYSWRWGLTWGPEMRFSKQIYIYSAISGQLWYN